MRTYNTEGMGKLLIQLVQRLSGKTQRMLAVSHLAKCSTALAGIPRPSIGAE